MCRSPIGMNPLPMISFLASFFSGGVTTSTNGSNIRIRDLLLLDDIDFSEFPTNESVLHLLDSTRGGTLRILYGVAKFHDNQTKIILSSPNGNCRWCCYYR